MRYVFFINPTAGKGKGPALLLPAIEEYFKDTSLEYKVIVTESEGEAERRSREEAETGDEITVFSCGGDGTFSEVLNGTYGFSNVSLGSIPCGSGNDFLKQFDSSEPFSDIKSQMGGKSVPMDIIKVDDIFCMNICSLGMDAVVADMMTDFKRLPFVSGSLAYKLAVVKCFLKKIGINVKVTIDGVLLGTFNSLFVTCANGTTYGGGYKCSPGANPFDGRLEWLLVETVSKLRLPKFLKLYERGEHENLPYVKHGHCKVMEIEAERVAPINVDGEILHKQKVRFELLRGAVKFILPRGIYEKYAVPAEAAQK